MPTTATSALDDLMAAERSEVFAVDLRRGDVVILTYPEGTVEALQVLDLIARPYGDPTSLGIVWAPVMDLAADRFVDDERAIELRAEGFALALGMESRALARPDTVHQIVGAGVQR